MSRAVQIPATLAAAMILAIAVAVVVALEPAQATFPGKNGKIAYVGEGEIHTVWPSGTGDRQITTDTLAGAHQPAYSPDGSRIAYWTYDLLDPQHEMDYEIYTITTDGEDRRQITETETDLGALAPAYSPDGARIAYHGHEGDGDLEIYTVKAGDGSGTLQLTHNNKRDKSPTYSPNGDRIAYGSWDGQDYEIYTIKVGGGDKRKVTDNTRDDSDPDYSPGGRRIAYSSFDGHDSEIYTIGVGGGDRKKVTNNAREEGEPSYSPNGWRIVYASYESPSDPEIYTITTDGEDRRQVTHNSTYDVSPSWGSR